MIVPMKKVSLIVRNDRKREALKKLRKLGTVHIEAADVTDERLIMLSRQLSLLETAVFTVGNPKDTEQCAAGLDEALAVADKIALLCEEKKQYLAERITMISELERLKGWGSLDPEAVKALADKGIKLSLCEMPRSEYENLPDTVKTVPLSKKRSGVKFVFLESVSKPDADTSAVLDGRKLDLPELSTEQMRQKISELNALCEAADAQIADYARYTESFKRAIKAVEKEIEFESCAESTEDEALSSNGSKAVSVASLRGFTPVDRLDSLKRTAADNCWGLLIEDPTPEDNVPTELKNNRLVSLIYPLTDFLGTVPGYFEYDISGWFLAFILIFFGIIFGDGGYGLLICAASVAAAAKSLFSKKAVSPTVMLIGLFGLSTVIWGTLTCTWFGLSPDRLPEWLKSLSVPVISNVYADRLWYPPWTSNGAGLTTAQNLQIFCFSLALIQLTIAHIKGAVRNKASIKILGDIGSVLQLLGIYYLVLNLVVNAKVFGFGLKLRAVSVGTVAVTMITVGFVLCFVFSNYEGSLAASVLSSLKNIVSVLLGVVNVFSDIVSYIRLWAVGLAGAAISATVNELASPLFGNFMFMLFAIVLLVFGHGLNMILNVLSVIVHGIRLNTLEFSTHLDMSWSGHKFKPFKEQTD